MHGATGVDPGSPDIRIKDYANLPNGAYPLVDKNGKSLYDTFAGSPVHRFFQMWQQSDCTVQHASRENPSGCQRDLYPFVITTFAGLAEEGMGTSMAFFNMNGYIAVIVFAFTFAELFR